LIKTCTPVAEYSMVILSGSSKRSINDEGNTHQVRSLMMKSGWAASICSREWLVSTAIVVQPAALPLRTPFGASSKTMPEKIHQSERLGLMTELALTIFWTETTSFCSEEIRVWMWFPFRYVF
jgi:hypothetical protein